MTSELISAFGPKVAPNGKIDRKKLAAAVFGQKNTPALLHTLNTITHKYVMAEMRELVQKIKQSGARAVLIDAPQLFEAHLDAECDLTVCVLAPQSSLYRKRNLIFRRSMHLKERDGLEQRIYAVVRYIDSNISSITSVNELSKDLGYSHSYLSHVFKEKMGITLQGYINAKRIESSLQYLRNQSFSITQIAQMLEYDTVQSFGKAFKKIMNCSPSEYRSQIIQRGMAVEKKEITQEDKVYE